MPIYEYRCTECGHEMSHFHRRRSDPKPPCEECGEDALEKLISLTSFSLKGDGWYVTDYKSRGSAASDPDSGADTGASTSADTSADASSGGSESASSASSSSSSSAASGSSSADAA